MGRFRKLSQEMKEIYAEAVITGDWETVLMFLEVGINPQTALSMAVNFDQVEIVRLLLAFGANPNAKDESKQTPLFYIYSDHPIMTKLLLSAGANPNAKDIWGYTPLHMHVPQGSLETVKVLLLHDANPNIKNISGETPLHLAEKHEHIEMIQLLKRFRAG